MGLTSRSTRVVTSIAAPANAELIAAASGLEPAAKEAPSSGPEGAVELRLDHLEEPPDLGALRAAFGGRTLVATWRTAAQGGRFRDRPDELASLLRAAIEAGFDLVDVEHEVQRGAAAGSGPLLGLPPERAIVSHHDLAAVPADLDSLAAAMSATGARYVKVVGTAADSLDALRILAFQRRRSDGRLSAFAMGEAGLCTRALAPYLGASLMYGSLDAGRETAPGQIPASDLREVFGVGTERVVERLACLLGGVVSHSLSPALHNSLFLSRGTPALYVPVAMKSLAREIDLFVSALDGLGLPLAAASVTIPFKEEAGAFAGGQAAVNTLVRTGPGTFTTANTDRLAMESLLPVGAGAIAVVLGAGGTARAAVDALLARGFSVGVHGRSPLSVRDLCRATGAHVVESLSDTLPHAFVLVNATPLGLKARDPLPCPAELLSPRLTVLDAPYRKGEETSLVKEARARGARVVDGRRLLVEQGALQARLFTGGPVGARDLLSALPRRHRDLFPEDLR